MNILVLAGGYSRERNVSLSSGAMITEALRRRGHNVALIDSYAGVPDGQICGFIRDDGQGVSSAAAKKDALKRCMESLCKQEINEDWKNISTKIPNLRELKAAHSECGDALIGPNVLDLAAVADVVFLALHGGCGEDGRLPAALDLMGVHYTGSDYLSSGLAMNKHMTKVIAKAAGIPVPEWKLFTITDDDSICRAMEDVQLPVVVKNLCGGSSIGVYIARTGEELYTALNENRGEQLIFEQYIEGREIQMGFLDGRALPSIEITVGKDFYNYENKYQKGLAIEKTPADILPSQEKEMGEMLLKVAAALNLYSYARADFIIDKSGRIWFIEINTLPGMTSTSLLPQEAAAAGYSFDSLCEKIVELALSRKAGSE